MARSTKISIRKIITAGIVGLAGGVITIASVVPGAAAMVLGSLLGAGVTSIAEYQREIKANSTEATKNF
ncbi:hypothetical protein SAMN05518672_10376 [Chitinophaga sp. CF118]|uniref:hypothetical protein n=1 Tax=Chitinophaga sp. CF118 TaxID=1884367 RepID=UPI0008E48E64|nr:hypothetical protein [Chitinophaga sp. CF118]SFD75413.1 hypothetical protein SAMN05518672_10376 [Chitinophaga sp. CF118]